MLLAFSFCSDLAGTWSSFCPSHLYLYGKPSHRPVICEQWAVLLSAVAVCKLSAHMGWLLSSSLPCEGNRADGTPCSLGLTGCKIVDGIVWPMRTDGDDCFVEKKQEYLLG